MEPRPILGEKGIGRLAIASIGPALLILTRSHKPKSSPLVCAFLHWGLFEVPGINLTDVDVPIIELKAGQLPDAAHVRELVAEVQANVKRISKRAGSEAVRSVLDDLKAFDADPDDLARQLPGPHLKNGHGTQFYIQPFDESVTASIDEPTGPDMPPPLTRTLIGFSNAMLPDRPEPRIRTSFRDHGADGDVEELLAGESFFTPEEFQEADHRIVGTFDKFGRFRGTVDIYGEETVDYELPWPGGEGNALDCGPFSLSVAVVQGDKAASRLDAESYALLNGKLREIGGLYIYRDGIRVLPYGNQDFDWIGLERSRSEHAGRTYFSYRRMFGTVEIDHENNGSLVEKAGREGFRENRAYRQFRGVVRDFFRNIAVDVFVSGGAQAEAFLAAKAERDRKAELRAEREKLARVQRKQFATEIDQAYEYLTGGAAVADLQRVVDRLDARLTSAVKRAPRDTEEQFIAAELDARRELADVLSRCRLTEPTGVGLTLDMRRDFEGYQVQFATFQGGPYADTARRISSLVDERSEALRLPPDPRVRIERLVEENIANARAEVDRNADDARQAASELDTRFERLLQVSQEKLEQTLSEAMNEATRIATRAKKPSDLAEGLASLDEQIADVLEREVDTLRVARAILDSVDLRRNGDGLAATSLGAVSDLEEELLALRERSNVDLELAQLGMAVEVISHEFGGTVRSMRRNLRRLKAWADVNEDLHPLYTDLRTSFEHLDGYLNLFTPLQRRLRRTKTRFRGAEVFRFLEELFEERLKEAHVQLEATQAFRDHELIGFRATFYPVLVNLVDNAIFWTRRSRRSGRERTGVITLDAHDDAMYVRDNGSGIAERDRERIFELWFTLKEGGRGAGLYISRAVLAREGYVIDAVEPASDGGAVFRIMPSPNTAEDE